MRFLGFFFFGVVSLFHSFSLLQADQTQEELEEGVVVFEEESDYDDLFEDEFDDY